MLGFTPISSTPLSDLGVPGQPTPSDVVLTTDSIILSGSLVSISFQDSEEITDTFTRGFGYSNTSGLTDSAAIVKVNTLSELVGPTDSYTIDRSSVFNDQTFLLDEVIAVGPASELLVKEALTTIDSIIFGTVVRTTAVSTETLAMPSSVSIRSTAVDAEVLATPSANTIRTTAASVEILVPSNRNDWIITQSDDAGVTDSSSSSVVHAYAVSPSDDAGVTDSNTRDSGTLFSQAGNDDSGTTDSIITTLTRIVDQQDSAYPTDSDTIVLSGSGFIGWGIPLH